MKALVPENYTADTLLLAFPEFLSNVSQIISDTSKSTIQSYLVWKLVNAYSSYVEGPEVQPIVQFDNALSGKVLIRSMWFEMIQ